MMVKEIDIRSFKGTVISEEAFDLFLITLEKQELEVLQVKEKTAS